MSDDHETVEKLAAYAHDAWSGWMRYLFSKCDGVIPNTLSALDDNSLVIPAEFVQRWVRQMNTPYDDLPEGEKESDRVEARRILEVIGGG